MRQVWTYTARDPQGNLFQGEIESESKDLALGTISERGLIPTKVELRVEKFSLSSILGNFGSGNLEKLIIFTKQLMTLNRAGIPLLRALGCIERGSAEIAMKDEVEGIRDHLRSGASLSQALTHYPKKFPPIYVASIAAGETSGTLDEVLGQLAALVEKELVLSRQLKSALRYPIMVITAISLAVFTLMTFVIPRFTSLYGKFGAELPLPTKIVIFVSNIFSSYWLVIIALVALGLFGLKKALSTPGGRLKWDRFLLKIPVMGDLIVKANVSRFAAMLNILYQSGVPMVSCLNILRETATNKVIAAEIAELAQSFEKGQEIGVNPEKYQFFPSMALEMFQVGLESGSVETIMAELASHYEMELDYKSRHLTALLEPILTIAIGGMVLVLALSIFLPMWNLIKVFR
jgi:MSHA biogenesis protein MshG